MTTTNRLKSPSGEITIKLFGPPQIFVDGVAHSFKRRKSYALLAYLAVNQKPYSREYLASLLWPETPDKTASKRLRNLLTDIRSVLTEDLLYSEGDVITLDASLQVDVRQFEACAQPFYRQSLTACLSPQTLQQLECATQLYTDRFLNGFNSHDSVEYDDWQYLAGERYQNIALGMFAALAHHYLYSQQPDDMYNIIQKWLTFEPLSEEAHRLLMKLYIENNRLDKALHQYHMLVRLLQRQEGVSPLPQTKELYDKIRNPELEAVSTV